MAENRRNNPNANRRPVPQGRGQAGSANRRPVQGQGNNPARPQGKPNGRPVGKPGSKPNSKPQQMRKRKLQSKPVNNPQPSMPAPSPEELAKKQEAEIERINKQIQEAEQKKYERDIPKESRKEKKQKVKKEKKVKEKKKSLDSHVKADRNAVINGVFGAIAASAAILVLSFVVIHLINYVAEKPQFAFIADGAIEHTIGAKALIVRDEKPVQSGATGELITSVTEGSRVATAQSLAMIVPEDKKSTVADLHNVQSQISDVQQEIVKTGSVAEADKVYKDYNSKIEPIIDSIRKKIKKESKNNISQRILDLMSKDKDLKQKNIHKGRIPMAVSSIHCQHTVLPFPFFLMNVRLLFLTSTLTMRGSASFVMMRRCTRMLFREVHLSLRRRARELLRSDLTGRRESLLLIPSCPQISLL